MAKTGGITGGFLRFANDEDARDVIFEIGWTGPWPPPERLYLATGVSTGRMVVAEESAIAKMKLDSPDWMTVVAIQMFARVRASKLTDDMLATTTHVMRGAVYTPVFAPFMTEADIATS